MHGLTPLGSTGEFAYLSWPQQRRVVEVTLAAAAGRVPVVAGVAATTTAEAVRQAVALEGMGCAGILAILEAYFPVPEDGVVAYFSAIAQAVSCPVVLYTNPQFQRSDLSLGAIERLAELPNIRYLKDASTNTGRLLSIMNRVERPARRLQRVGPHPGLRHAARRQGLDGGAGLPDPAPERAPVRALPRGSLGRRDGPAARAVGLNDLFAKYALAACIKGGLEVQGFPVGDPLAAAAGARRDRPGRTAPRAERVGAL